MNAQAKISGQWTRVGDAAQVEPATFQYKITYKLNADAERSRDKACMGYMMRVAERVKGPIYIDPNELSELWTLAYIEGRGDAAREFNLDKLADPAEPEKTKPKKARG